MSFSKSRSHIKHTWLSCRALTDGLATRTVELQRRLIRQGVLQVILLFFMIVYARIRCCRRAPVVTSCCLCRTESQDQLRDLGSSTEARHVWNKVPSLARQLSVSSGNTLRIHRQLPCVTTNQWYAFTDILVAVSRRSGDTSKQSEA
jgi:hypothetical protein